MATLDHSLTPRVFLEPQTAHPQSSNRSGVLRAFSDATQIDTTGLAADALRLGVSQATALRGSGLSDEAQIAQAVADDLGSGEVDLTHEGGDAELFKQDDYAAYAQHGIFPYSKVGAFTAYICADAVSARHGLAKLTNPPSFAIAYAGRRSAIQQSILESGGAEALRMAASGLETLPKDQRAEPLTQWRWRAGFAAFLAVPLIAAVFAPAAVWTAFLVLVLTLCLVSTIARFATLVTALRPVKQREAPKRSAPNTSVTILIPLHREVSTVRTLLNALAALDYPKALLDVKLIVEADDVATQEAIRAVAPPAWISVLVAPAGQPRTKPRALNLALPFAEGEIVAVFDAEDIPHPDQVNCAVEALSNAPPSVVCAQAQLSHFNADESWLTRCFSLEYALWFDVFLPGLTRLGLPVTLGGTSLYFRREALIELGGWDAHNVTEDADLGIRLARAGKRVILLPSTTMEEAPISLWQWIGQRSRWIKGFLVTLIVHARKPVALVRDLGVIRSVWVCAFLLDGLLCYIAKPLFLLAFIVELTSGEKPWSDVVPAGFAGIAAAIFIAAHLSIALLACLAALRRFGAAAMLRVPLLWIYWPFGALSAVKAIWELIAAPSYWDKTEHGRSARAPGVASVDPISSPD